MYDQYEVMEVTLSGHWFEIVQGVPSESYGDRRFQGIGKTTRDAKQNAANRAGKESEIPNFKGSDLGRFPLVLADFWTSDHLSERSRSVDAFSGTRARGTLTLKRR